MPRKRTPLTAEQYKRRLVLLAQATGDSLAALYRAADVDGKHTATVLREGRLPSDARTERLLAVSRMPLAVFLAPDEAPLVGWLRAHYPHRYPKVE